MRAVTPGDAVQLAALHLDAYRGQHVDWDKEFFDRLLLLTTTRGLLTDAGFILWQQTQDFGEIITLAVQENAKRRGVGRQLLKAYETALTADGIAQSILDVAEDNIPARGLYERAGYMLINRRPKYYRHYIDGVERQVDALVMDKQLVQP